MLCTYFRNIPIIVHLQNYRIPQFYLLKFSVHILNRLHTSSQKGSPSEIDAVSHIIITYPHIRCTSFSETSVFREIYVRSMS